MDKIGPPPNSSPEEIQAWNAMMDTMVTFIKASTNLMNTITKKVRYSAPKPGGPVTLSSTMGGCEPECEACHPKPPCGECQKTTPPSPAPVPASSRSVVKTPTSNPQVAETPSPPAAKEQPESGDPPEDETPAEDPAGDEGATEDAEAPAAEEAVEEAPQKAPSAAETPKAAEVSAAAGDKQCVCGAIRAKREDKNKDWCSCSRKNRKKDKGLNEAIIEEEDEEQPSPEEEVEQVCGCGPTPGNTAAMVQEMVEKLANAQQEITQLQEELARLQRMDISKRTGPHAGPNPAALYREIMKDNEAMPSARYPPNVGQRLFQPNTADSANTGFPTQASPVCVPCEDSSNRGLGTPFGSSPDMYSASRPMMRPHVMAQSTPLQSPGRPGVPAYYPGSQSPCRRSPSRTGGQSPAEFSGYSGNLPSNVYSPDPNYWSRLGEYGSPLPPMQRIACPSIRSPPKESPIRRRIICASPRASPAENCNPDNCSNLPM